MPLSNAMGRKFLAALLSVFLVLSTIPAIPIARAEGTDWTEYTPISTPAELDSVRNNLAGKYYLTADIVFTADDFASGGAFYNGGIGWLPIGARSTGGFTGTFDGNGHTIKGLYCNATSSTPEVGLFGYSSGLIRNLGMIGGAIRAVAATSSGRAGGIVGFNIGTISNSYNTGDVSTAGYQSWRNCRNKWWRYPQLLQYRQRNIIHFWSFRRRDRGSKFTYN